MNILPDTSPAKMGLFGISGELLFGSLQHWQASCKFPLQQGKETTLIEGKGSWGRAKVNKRVHGFLLAESLPGKKSISSSHWALLLQQGIDPTLFN